MLTARRTQNRWKGETTALADLVSFSLRIRDFSALAEYEMEKRRMNLYPVNRYQSQDRADGEYYLRYFLENRLSYVAQRDFHEVC